MNLLFTYQVNFNSHYAKLRIKNTQIHILYKSKYIF